MLGVGRVLWRWRQSRRIAADRCRALLLCGQGARLGRKVMIGRGTMVDRPYCLVAGDRVFIEPDVYLKIVGDQARLEIGAHTFIGRGSEIDVLGTVSIGSHTLISPGCFIVDHAHGTACDRRIDEQDCRAAPVIIGNDVWIGTGAVILLGVHIGDGAVVGANAVVREDVPAGALVAGVPARLIRERRG